MFKPFFGLDQVDDNKDAQNNFEGCFDSKFCGLLKNILLDYFSMQKLFHKKILESEMNENHVLDW